MENLKIEGRYLKLCYEFRAVIRFMKVAFYRPDYQKLFNVSVDQKTRSSICFSTCGRVFKTLSRVFGTLDGAFKTLDRTFESLREI